MGLGFWKLVRAAAQVSSLQGQWPPARGFPRDRDFEGHTFQIRLPGLESHEGHEDRSFGVRGVPGS